MRIILINYIDKDLIMDHLNPALISTTQSKELATPHHNTPIASKMLFAHGDVVLIQHQDDQYYLRRTRNGKLILTK